MNTLEIVAQSESAVQLRLSLDFTREPWASLLAGSSAELEEALGAAQVREAELHATVAALQAELEQTRIDRDAWAAQVAAERAQMEHQQHENAHLRNLLHTTVEQLSGQVAVVPAPQPALLSPARTLVAESAPVAMVNHVSAPVPEPTPWPVAQQQHVSEVPVPEPTPWPVAQQQHVSEAVQPVVPEPTDWPAVQQQHVSEAAQPVVPEPTDWPAETAAQQQHVPEVAVQPVPEPTNWPAETAAQQQHVPEVAVQPAVQPAIQNSDEEEPISFGYAHGLSRLLNRVQLSLGLTPGFAKVDDF